MDFGRVSLQLICLISSCYFTLQAKKPTLLKSIHIKIDSLEIVNYNQKYLKIVSKIPNTTFYQIEVIKSIPTLYARIRGYDPQNDRKTIKMDHTNICAYLSNTFKSKIRRDILGNIFVNLSSTFSCPVREGKYLLKSEDPDFMTLPQIHPIGKYQFMAQYVAITRGEGDLLKLIYNYSVESVK